MLQLLLGFGILLMAIPTAFAGMWMQDVSDDNKYDTSGIKGIASLGSGTAFLLFMSAIIIGGLTVIISTASLVLG